MKRILQIILIAAFAFSMLGAGASIMAQENTAADTASAGAMDAVEQVPAQALDSSTPSLLPDSPFYFLKEWTRRIRSAFTFNKTKKTELENSFANEKLLELRKMAEKGATSEKIQKATENYQKAVERVKNAADKIKDKAENNPEVNKFLEKFTSQQVLHERILGKLEAQVPEQALEKIKEAREQHIERFGQVMQKLENRQEKIKENLEKAVQSSENTAQNSGEEATEFLDRLKEKMPEAVQQKIEAIKIDIVDKVITTSEQSNATNSCPRFTKPSPNFCRQGKIKVEKNDNGCIIGIKCVSLEQRVCTQEYAPVCGKDGKTYSNKCTAESAGVEISYTGECATVNCRSLWWFDANSKECGQKKFCGAYMYQTLRTFESKIECEKVLNAKPLPIPTDNIRSDQNPNNSGAATNVAE